jgi:hypothetical protein
MRLESDSPGKLQLYSVEFYPELYHSYAKKCKRLRPVSALNEYGTLCVMLLQFYQMLPEFTSILVPRF